MNTLTCILPDFWASALINNDRSSLSDADEAQLDAWLSREQLGPCLSCSDESFFSRRHDAWLEMPKFCGCLEYTFEVPAANLNHVRPGLSAS